MAVISGTLRRVAVLPGDDVPGALRDGWKPRKTKNKELRFWFQCRSDAGKGLKMKAELVKR